MKNIGFQVVTNTRKLILDASWGLSSFLHIDNDDGEKYLAIFLDVLLQRDDYNLKIKSDLSIASRITSRMSTLKCDDSYIISAYDSTRCGRSKFIKFSVNMLYCLNPCFIITNKP